MTERETGGSAPAPDDCRDEGVFSLPPSRLEVWARREAPTLRALPFLLLAVSMLITALAQPSGGSLAVNESIAGGAAVWLAVFRWWEPPWARTAVARVGYFVGLYALMAVLVVRAPWFGFFAFTGYIEGWQALRGRWRFAGICAVAVLSATSQIGGRPSFDSAALTTWIMMIVINTTVAGGGVWFNMVSDQQRAQLQTTLNELTATNDRLALSLRENAGLHAQLVAQAREAGVTDERQRLAREIHDTLAQGLTGVITQLEAAGQAAPLPPPVRRHLDTAAALARQSLTEARRSVRALQPEPLVQARLPEALADVVTRWSTLNGVSGTVTTTGDAQPMRPEIEVALLRTAQEALANVAKHAAAGRVGLTLSYMGDLVTLDVRDDGVGFDPVTLAAAPDRPDPADPTNGGFGLTGMRQRIEGLAGTLVVESEPGGGTAVSASVPALTAEAAR